jgi:hypothetical protein
LLILARAILIARAVETVADAVFSESIFALGICEASECHIFVRLNSHKEMVLVFRIWSKDFKVSVIK